MPTRRTLALLLLGAAVPSAQGQQGPRIDSIRPRTLQAGEMATIYGRRLSAAGHTASIRTGGVPSEILSASADQLVFRVPARGLPCRQSATPTRISVSVGGPPVTQNYPVNSAHRVQLAPGEAATPADLRGALCVRLGAGRYLVLAANTATDTRPPTQYALWGVATATPAPALPRLAQHGRLEATSGARGIVRRGGVDVHGRDVAGRRGAFRQAADAAQDHRKMLRGFQWRPIPKVGDVESFRFNVDIKEPWCRRHDDVRAYAVYVGSRALIFVDSAAPALPAPDSAVMANTIAEIGAEFDSVMYALVRDHFGDPLVFDSRLDGDQRVRILFTPAMNQHPFSPSGSVNPCDFYPLSADNLVSNEGEIVYVRMPNQSELFQEWSADIRSTLVHELKHVAAFAARRISGVDSEDPWLEEGMAKHAEEVYARRFTGASQGRNVGFAVGVRCDFWLAFSSCAPQPALMSRHFAMLYEFWKDGSASAPLTPDPPEFRTYGGSWSFIRYLVDRSGLPEDTVYRRITSATGFGATTLTQSTHVDFSAGFIDWLLASAVDDLPGFVPARDEHRLKSWDTRNVYAELYRYQVDTTRYQRDFPVQPRSTSFGPGGRAYNDRELPPASGELDLIQGGGFVVGIQQRNTRPLPTGSPMALAVIRIQ